MKRSWPLTLSIGAALAALAALAAVPARPAAPPPSAPAFAGATAAATRNTDEELRERERRELQREREESLDWGRDPFFPLLVAEIDEPELAPVFEPPPGAPGVRLTGISLMNGKHLAIVDRDVVHEGDVLPSGYVVTHIARTTITLRRGDSEVTLGLGDEK